MANPPMQEIVLSTRRAAGLTRWLHNVLGGVRADLTWRRAAFVALLCFVLSTQLLFQPDLFDDYALVDILRSWLETFTDALVAGVCITLTVTVIDNAFPYPSPWRGAALGGAVALGAVTSVATGSMLGSPAAFDLPSVRALGETLRLMMFGGVVTAAYAMLKRAARTADQSARAEVDRVALNRQLLEAKLQVLQAQIEPHFLFNSLANVKRLYRTAPQRGQQMLGSLMSYLRAALPQLREAGTTLGHEVALVGAYLDVLGFRMDKRLAFSIDVPQRLQAYPFPSMMLLTLVENAIKHGLNPSDHGGRIDVRAELGGATLMVTVADDGVGLQTTTGGTGIGLANTRSRLAAIYGEGAALVLAGNAPSGIVATIHIPLDHQQFAAAA